MTPDEINDAILGKPVREVGLMPKATADAPILFGQRPGVITVKLAKDESGELRVTGSPENIAAIKELFAWLPEAPE